MTVVLPSEDNTPFAYPGPGEGEETLSDAEKLRVVFMGTPDFAVTSLKSLIDDGQQVVAVVTAPDKPAGRGRTMQTSPVKDYALASGIPVLQPMNLKDNSFVESLRSYKPDLQVVVAFRMLPEKVWEIAKTGTINLHASLLPQYRGAAPINWALINGETKTGVTTFFINREIDTGEILMQEEVDILPEDNAGTLHDRLKITGSKLLVSTVHAIASGSYVPKSQSAFIKAASLKTAPKISKEDCRINWELAAGDINNFIRGLSPYPTAWSELKGDGRTITVKIFSSEAIDESHTLDCGSIVSDGHTYLMVATGSGFSGIRELQLAGKKRLKVTEFLKGFPNPEQYHFLV
ncbi:MAG: methionyl-tRNA formyltransferase [Bacteroidales bacterium]|nr:methionyl-tRNA formyltransferase [Bacteroidales bacterium]MBN2762578.1 methionyl-tRNA formyltransferase [Bacteroidales bacterium]